MLERKWIQGTLTTLLLCGALLSVIGAGVIAVLLGFAMDPPWLSSLMEAWLAAMAGFFVLGLFGLFAAAIERLTLRPAAPDTSLPESPLPRQETEKQPKAAAEKAGESKLPLADLTRQVRTYIDLEMWELAHVTAREILSRFPSAPIAGTLSRNLNELRWKAEPKFVDQKSASGASPSASERNKVGEGLDQAVEQVKTYMELEMWELARQKTHSVMKHFPDTPQSDKLAKWYPEIDRGCREAAEAEANTADPSPPGKAS